MDPGQKEGGGDRNPRRHFSGSEAASGQFFLMSPTMNSRTTAPITAVIR